MLDKIIEWLRDSTRLSQIVFIGHALQDSGLLRFLEEKAKVQIPVSDTSPNYVMVLAKEAARSAGYRECLEDIINFRELYIEPKGREPLREPDFGARKNVVAQGSFTAEELHKLNEQKKAVAAKLHSF